VNVLSNLWSHNTIVERKWIFPDMNGIFTDTYSVYMCMYMSVHVPWGGLLVVMQGL
jgi:hypothetical protein